jgi:molybdopterin molybdotransferase
MISVNEATSLIKEKLVINSSLIAQSIVADRDYPPFNRVMMDGIAINYQSYNQGLREFPIAGIQPAGIDALGPIESNQCIEIMTGAPMPEGLDLVVPYEHIEISESVAKIIVEASRVRMDNVHLKGSDCKAGEVVLGCGHTLNGPHVGIAASMGILPKLTESSRILLISTGDELVDIHETPLDFQIRRSNVHAIKRSLEINGFNNITLNHLKDDRPLIESHFIDATKEYDILIYSGGVSKGKFDYLPSVWNDLGVTKYFHEVAQRPGKPLWFGKDESNQTTVVGLPGNPVSSLVCLHRYLIQTRPMFAKLEEEVTFSKPMTYFLPATLENKEDGTLWAKPLKIKNSGEFTALANSDGFLELPAETSCFPRGSAYAFWPWKGL